ncbi:nucleotide exchange factor GrpE [Streptomyces sp. NPDC057116]|uniref:nucleotide exchange factor GrpE n=1 Tax=Streptomyces sp. NPDC057116 TaxID=3346023 RepID=UPI003638FC9F
MRPGTRRGLTTVNGRTDPPPMIAPAAPDPSAALAVPHRDPPTGRTAERPGHAESAASGARTGHAEHPAPQARSAHPEPAASDARAGHPEPAAPGARSGLPEPAASDARPEHPAPGEPAAPQAPPAAPAGALAERTADLQRLKAEYDNYRGRVHRDRLAVREAAVANVLRRFLPVFDAIAEAARQGELTGGFQRVALALDGEAAALGLRAFGTVGDPFDPRVHQAVAYRRSRLVERPVCTEIVRPGYRVGDHLLRPADVTVTGPAQG